MNCYTPDMPHLTTQEAADRLRLSDAYVRQLILAGRINSTALTAGAVGRRAHVIEERELEAFDASRRPRDRPRARSA